MANYTSAEKVAQVIRSGDTVEWKRGNNRAKITQSANGAPPLEPSVAKKLQVAVNVNFGELASLLSHARRQYYNAFLKTSHFFRVKLPDCPEQYRAEYEATITDEINKPLKKSKTFFHQHQYKWTDVVLNGVGACMWEDQESWLPKFVAREDLRIPTDTETNFENLEWFAVRHLYTVGELVRKVFSKDSSKDWKKKAVANILKNYKQVNYDTPMSYIDWETQPEKIAELVKQNLGYYESDAVPKVPLWTFYFKDVDKKWYQRVIPDTPSVRGESGIPEQFLYTTEESCADNLLHLLQCQFGDLSFKTPFMFHSVRSLGFELLEPTYWTNLTRCRFLQHVHENFNRWIQLSDPGNKQRAQEIEFNGPTVRLPVGVHVLAQNERHQINPEMVEMALAQLKQLMQEASATYTQETDTGTAKEQTAFETGVKVQQVNAMLSGLMLVATTLETYFDEEICRRFCLPDSQDDDVKEFQRRCIQLHGIPRKWLNVNRWSVEVEAPLGGGNPTMEQVEAQKAIELKPLANPTAQGEMLHSAFTTFFGSKRAARWAPVNPKGRVTDAQVQAGNDFASLMWGIPVDIREELNVIDQIDVLLRRIAMIVTRIKQSGGLPSQTELMGMMSVLDHTGQLNQLLSQVPSEKARVRSYGQALGNLGNYVKAFQQQMQQAAEKAAKEAEKNGKHSEIEAQAMVLEAQTQNRIALQESQSRLQLQSAEFMAEQKRKQAEFTAELERERAEFLADEQRENQKLAEELSRNRKKTDADIENKRKTAAAQAAAVKTKPKASKSAE